MSGTCRGKRSHAPATSQAGAPGSVAVASAKWTLPGKIAKSTATLAGPAHLVLRTRPAPHTSSATPEARMSASCAGRMSGINGR